MNRAEKQRAFVKWWDGLSLKVAPAIRQGLIQKCQVKAYTLSDWRRGRSEIPELLLPVINEVAGKDIFNSIR